MKLYISLAVLFLASCGSDPGAARRYCERITECNEALNGFSGSVDTCVKDTKELVSDGVVSQYTLEICTDCIGSTTCGSVAAGNCDAACE